MRLKIIFILFIVGYFFLLFKLFSWQIVKGKDLAKDAQGQQQSFRSVSAPRGNIYASDNTWLVARSESWLIFASIPDLKDNPREIANKLANFIVEDPLDRRQLLEEASKLEGLLNRKGSVWVPLEDRVSNDTKKNIQNLKLSGIGFEKEEARFYPEASSAAQLLGFVGKNDQGENMGYFGLEGYYDPILAGKPGFLSQEKDAHGLPILLRGVNEVLSSPGVDLLTHIDKVVQNNLEKKLSDGIAKYGAKGGTAIVMDPKTGAILGMASYPSYDPRKYWESSDGYFKNPAVSDTFEPGSIFKPIVMASALDAKVVEPDTACDKCQGPLKVDKYTIETWNGKYHPDSTMQDVIVNSDNVGMAFVGEKLGADSLYNYLDKFGIGKLTGIDLQGEVTPHLRDKGTWNIVDLATASFGQGVAVTPIQMVRAISVIANKGLLVTPEVVDKLKGEAWSEDIKPKDDGRVISQKAAGEITEMMVEAAKHGESKWTSLSGFNVAGKTGTAQIPISGHYDKDKTIGSFIGFAPAKNPKFVMLVTLKEPSTSPWASETAAPLWYSIANDLFTYFGIQPGN